MDKVMLYMFSGSGNTSRVALKVKEVFERKGFECFIEKMECVKDIDVDDYAYIGLLFPVAIQSTFPLVWTFIENMPETTAQNVFMIDTMEQFSGGVVGPVKRILQTKGYNCLAAIEIKMVNSMQVKPIQREKIAMLNKKAFQQVEPFVIELLDGKGRWARIPLLSDLMRRISTGRKIWTKTSQQLSVREDLCIQCKVCVRHCPVHALTLSQGRIKMDHSVCISCMRCIHQCPKDAFRLKERKVLRFELDNLL